MGRPTSTFEGHRGEFVRLGTAIASEQGLRKYQRPAAPPAPDSSSSGGRYFSSTSGCSRSLRTPLVTGQGRTSPGLAHRAARGRSCPRRPRRSRPPRSCRRDVVRAEPDHPAGGQGRVEIGGDRGHHAGQAATQRRAGPSGRRGGHGPSSLALGDGARGRRVTSGESGRWPAGHRPGPAPPRRPAPTPPPATSTIARGSRSVTWISIVPGQRRATVGLRDPGAGARCGGDPISVDADHGLARVDPGGPEHVGGSGLVDAVDAHAVDIEERRLRWRPRPPPRLRSRPGPGEPLNRRRRRSRRTATRRGRIRGWTATRDTRRARRGRQRLNLYSRFNSRLRVVEAHQAGLGMEIDARVVPHPPADHLHQRSDVVGRTAGIRLEEVGVLGRDLGGPEAQALASGGIDQPAGRVVGRVGEDRPGILATGLVGTSPGHDLGDLASPAARSPGRAPGWPSRPRGGPRRPTAGSRARGPPPAQPPRTAGASGRRRVPRSTTPPCRTRDRRRSCGPRRRSTRVPRPPIRSR